MLRFQVFVAISILLFTLPPAIPALTAQTLQWSGKAYGPDGPWQAVTIEIGSPPQPVDLLPGGSWMTNVISPSVCQSGQACYASDSGVYNPYLSTTAVAIDQTGAIHNSTYAGTVGALSTLFGTANWVFDTVLVPLKNGVAGNSLKAELDDFDLLVLEEAYSTLPDGTNYSVQVGKLALGSPAVNQSWAYLPNNPNWNGTLLTSSLFAQGRTPSNSYGMHIGSAVMGIPGSLNIGGYDQNRALAPASSQVYSIDHLPIDLLDIGIGVAEGQSPFNFTVKSGLMASGNSSIGLSMSVDVDATVPYLYLPSSTCDAITRNLPVTFQPRLGLYLWNTTDTQYKTIVSSPAFLGFTFRLNSSISQNFTIKVPFALLNLNLTAPLVSATTPYFPCRPGQGADGNFALGRAFMQAAFVGVNWQLGNGRWFLAQAPGPNTPSSALATAIGDSDNFIVTSANNWLDTWRGAWTVVSSTSGNISATGLSTSIPLNSRPTGLSKRTVAGIAVGVALGAIAFTAAAFLLYRRRVASARSQHSSSIGTSRHKSVVPPPEGSSSLDFGPRELDSTAAPLPASRNPVEMAG